MGDWYEWMEQEGCATMLNKVRSRSHEEPHNEAPGILDSGAHASALKSSQSPFTSPLSQLTSIPSMKNSEAEVRMQRFVPKCFTLLINGACLQPYVCTFCVTCSTRYGFPTGPRLSVATVHSGVVWLLCDCSWRSCVRRMRFFAQ